MFKLYLLVVTAIALCSQTVQGLLNGVNATRGEFPHHAFLEMNELVVCQGALINERNVLTAGHCINTPDVTVNTLFVRLGSINVKGGEVHDIISKTFLINFATNPGVDIGIVTLKHEIRFSRTLNKIELPPDNYNIIPGSEAVATSAGATKMRKQYSDVLQKLDVKIINQTECIRMTGKSSPEFVIDENHICTYAGLGKGMLDADCGAPLVQNGFIIGVQIGFINTRKGLRGKTGTANPSRFPAFFTNVIKHLPLIRHWINRTNI